MLDSFYESLGTENVVPQIVISVSLMLMGGFLLTRLTKLLKLPNVTGYIIAGILMGPNVLGLVPERIIDGMSFISDIALAFIAFSAGEFFRMSTLKKNGGKVAVITLFEALLASVFVFVLTYFILNINLAFSIILSALASATAPASTMMTIRQTNAHGKFVNTLLSVVALDDIVSLVAFSVAVSVAMASLGEGFSASVVLLPIVKNLALVTIGVGLGFLLKVLMQRRSNDNRLIVSVAMLFAVCGIGAMLDVSPLLSCMAMGMVYINSTDDELLFKQLNYFAPPILLLFFVRSGLNFKLTTLFDTSAMGSVPLIVVGVLYFVVRIAGKYLGAFLGSAVTRYDTNVRNYMGLGLIPQAGVAIGLAAIGARLFESAGYTEYGQNLETVILSSSVLYELIGPACAKLGLKLSHSFGDDVEETPAEPEEVIDLKEKLLQIQGELAIKEYARSDEEQAFLEVATDDNVSSYLRRKFKNRR